MLSEREQRQLEDIEHQLSMDDPKFALTMRGVPHTRSKRWRFAAYAVLVAWLVGSTVTMVGHWWLAGDILMLIALAGAVGLVVVKVVVYLRHRRAVRLVA
jgi:hypothetical protein